MNRLAFLSLALLGAACSDIGNLGPDRGGDVFWDGGDRAESNIDGFMRGTHATVQGFDDNISQGWMDRSAGWSYLEMHVEGPYGWAMLGVNLDRDILDIEPGTTVVLSGYSDGDRDPSADEGEVISGDVIGCSGPDFWDTMTDEPAEEASISLSENPETGAIEITVDADFGDNGTVTGTATVPPSANRG